MIGSYTKQFTAAAILLLEDEGYLNIENTLNLYIPDFPSGDKIKIKHLLNHTSGLQREPDYRRLLSVVSAESIEDFIIPRVDEETAQEILSRFELKNGSYELKRNLNETQVLNLAYLLFSMGYDTGKPTLSISDGVLKITNGIRVGRVSPGDSYRYSNLGYMILGLVIEKSSGMRYEDFIRTRLFEPLDMSYSGFNYDPVKNYGFAQGWYGFDSKRLIKLDKPVNGYLWPGAAGMIYSNIADINKWITDMNLILKESILTKMFDGYVESGIMGSHYGYGYFVNSKVIKGDARRNVWHDGRVYNYRTIISIFPEEKLRIVILSNRLDDNSIFYWPYIIAEALIDIDKAGE